MSLSRDALKMALFHNGTGLESIPGLRSEQLIPAVIAYLAEWDMTQFFGRVHDAIGKWEQENGKGFPIEYAYIEIHPYCLRQYWARWPTDRITDLFVHQTIAAAGPMRVYGIEMREDQSLWRTVWRLMLNGKMLTNGEVLEVV